MPWLSQVPSVLETWYPGQEDGNAVANVPFGVVNPSGKLPITFRRRLNPGQKKLAELTIDPAASNPPLSTWDTGRRQWTVTDGE